VPLVDLLKISDEDLAWLYPDRPHDEVVAGWHAASVGLVVITHGERGAGASTPTSSATVPARPVDVVDTVGAGDAFTSGLIAHLYHRGPLTRDALQELDDDGLTELLETAAEVAADTCTRAGAEPPWRRGLGAFSRTAARRRTAP
jgi:fructokinase